MTEANKYLVRRWCDDLWNQRDLDVCEELIAADYTEHAIAPFGTEEPGTVPGPSAMRQTVAWLTAQYPDITMTVECIIGEADLVVARVRSRGTFQGSAPGMPPPTGRTFDAYQTHWFRIADGKLAEHWATRDDLTAMLQIGLINGPARVP